MNIIIFYFSGTGNTWWTSMKLKEELESLGNSVGMYSLENSVLKEEGFLSKKIDEAGHIIIGYPIYGSDFPGNIREFIDNLPNVSDKKKFSAFCTQAAFSGDGSIFFQKEIEEKGYEFMQAFQINLTTNFHVALPPFSFFKPAKGEKLEKIKTKAAKKIKNIAEEIAKNEKYIEGKKFYQILLGGIQRYFFRRGEKKLPDRFKFIKDRCVKCGICAKTCPTGNIILELEDLDLKRKGNCLLCFRCYNFCPGLAINYGGKIKNPERYKRYTGPVGNLKISDIQR